MNLSKEKIKEAMEAQGINTFTELAEKLGITKNQLSVMLSGNYSPVKSRVEELCDLLEINLDAIVDLSFTPEADNITEINDNDVTSN